MSSGAVTVGIPVYNGAATLRRTVESVLAQTHRVAVVHISDNSSTDETPQIAQALADANETVRFTRHAASLGMSGNFGFVLQQAETEYFMWLAADDTIEPTYVERTLAALDADPNLVACVSRARFATDDGTIRPTHGTYPLLADTVTNLAAYLTDPSDNTRIFGLYRYSAAAARLPVPLLSRLRLGDRRRNPAARPAHGNSRVPDDPRRDSL